MPLPFLNKGKSGKAPAGADNAYGYGKPGMKAGKKTADKGKPGKAPPFAKKTGKK